MLRRRTGTGARALRSRFVFAAVLAAAVGLAAPHPATAQPATPPAPHSEPLPLSADAFSDSVGATPAQFRTDESGAATYSIPLYAPPGTAGMSPKMSLEYNARGGNGPLGVGWSIGGQSAITRCKKSIEHGDGAGPHPGINFDASLANDAFCLDGQRLLTKGVGLGACPASAAGGQEFALELDTSTRICGYLPSAGAQGYDRWLVLPKDGTTRRYSFAGNAVLAPLDGAGAIVPEHILTWAIDRIADATGNTIAFEYLRDNANGELNLSVVRYTGKVTTGDPLGGTETRATYNRVTFTYDGMPAESQRVDFLAGARLELTNRLRRVDVFGTRNNGAAPDTAIRVRSYTLKYDVATTGSRHARPVELRECAPNSDPSNDTDANGDFLFDQDACYAPTRLTWNAFTPTFPQGFQGAPTTSLTYSKALNYSVDYKVGDVNGDGRADLIFIKDRSCSGNGSDSTSGGSPQRFRYVISSGATASLALATPVNADVYAVRAPPPGTSMPGCTESGPATNWDNGRPIRWDTIWHLFDFTGDGRDDLLISTGSTWKLHKTVQSGSLWTFETTGTDLAIPATPDGDSRLADFSGDGLPDLWHWSPNGFAVRFLRRIVPATNVAYEFEPTNHLVTLAGTSEYADAFSLALTTFNGTQTADFDGDGVSDIALYVRECDPFAGAAAIQRSPAPAPTRSTYRVLSSTAFDDEGRMRPGAVGIGEVATPQGGSEPCSLPQDYSYYWLTFRSAGVQPDGTFLLDAEVCLTGGADSLNCLNSPATRPSLVDFNGDSLPDVIYRRSAGGSNLSFHYRINTGRTGANRFDPEALVGLTLKDKLADRIQMADLNGDKRTDLLYQTDCNVAGACTSPNPPNPGGRWPLRMRLFGVSGFGAELEAASGGGLVTIANQDPEKYLTLVIDTSGDGTADLIRYQADGASSQNLYAALGSLHFGGNDFIVGFTNGLGARHEVYYGSLVYSSIYTRAFDGPAKNWGRGAPVFDVFSPLWAVQEVRSSSPTPTGCDPGDTVCDSANTGPASVSMVRYRYVGARVQSGGRGFLGFRTIRTEDVHNKLVTSTEYRQDFPFIGRPAKSWVEKVSTLLPDPCVGNPDGLGCIVEPPPNCGPITCIPQAAAVVQSGKSITATKAGPLGGQLLTYAETAYASSPAFAAGTQQPVYPFTQSASETKYDLATADAQTQRVVSSNTVDAYGNLSSSQIETYNADNSLVHRVNTFNYFGCTVYPIAVQSCAIAPVVDAEQQRLGRLSLAGTVTHRPGQTDVTRRASFEYDATTRLLVAEIQGPYGDLGLTQDELNRTQLRTDHVLDGDGNRTQSVTCSVAHYANRAACLNLSAFQQRQWESDPLRVQRYSKAEYDGWGRFLTGSRTPFYDAAAGGSLFEAYSGRIGVTDAGALSRNALGDPLRTISAHGVVAEHFYGFLGRRQMSRTATGGFSRETYTWCQDAGVAGTGLESALPPAGAPRANCPAGAVYRVAASSVASVPYSGQSVVPTTYAYFDALGREVLRTARMFQNDAEDPTSVSRWASSTSRYDILGRARAASEPYFSVDPLAAQGGTRAGDAQTGVTPAHSKSTFDALARATTLDVPAEPANAPRTASMAYDKLKVTTTNPRSFQNIEQKNGLGESTSAIDPANFAVNYLYEPAGNLRQVSRTPTDGSTAGQAITTAMIYDRLGRKVAMTDPDRGSTTYRYNALGELVQQIDAKGQTQNRFYDALGRLWKRTEDRASGAGFVAEPTSQWEFDTGVLQGTSNRAFGLLIVESLVGANYSRTTSYDAYARVRQVQTTLDSVTYTERMTYDAFGRPFQHFDASTNASSPDGTLTQYSTDGFPIRTREAANGAVGIAYQEILALSPRGQVRKEKLHESASLVVTRTYDDNTGRLVWLRAGTSDGRLQDWTYTWDKHGSLTSRWNRAGLPGQAFDLKEDFTYDALDRLDEVRLKRFNGSAVDTLTLDLAYDQLGNLTSKTGLGAYAYKSSTASTGCTSVAGPHAVSLIGTKSYCYDANGNNTEVRQSGAAIRSIV